MTTNSERMPRGVYYIIGNEAAERFSFYGMKAILMVFMTQYLLNSLGEDASMTREQASTWYHTFVSAVYFFPMLGALLSDIFLGKYKTIILLSIVYCFGHLSLALMDVPFTAELVEPKVWLALGLGLIAFGSGGIKPCVSAHVGDQFDASKKTLLDKVFNYFYFAINFGSFFSTLATPWLLKAYGPAFAFGLPGILMFIATIIFYVGRKDFVIMPAVGWESYKKDIFGPQGLKALGRLIIIYFFIAFFWALYDQTGSSWVLQAESLNRTVNLGFMSFEILSSQLQAINPVIVMAFIPLFTFGVYPMTEKFVKLTALRKIGAGFFITALAFAIVAMTEQWIQEGLTPSMGWQLLAYLVITAAEVLISITALELSYTQAPNSMKSLVMAIFMLSISFGNVITASVNSFIQNADGTVKLQGASYYWFFTALVMVAGVFYVIAATFYQEKTYLQDHTKSVEE